MKKFTFPLGRIRDYKEQLLDREKNALATLNLEKNRLLARIDSLKIDYISIDTEMKSSARQGTTAMQLKLCQYRLDAIRYEEEEIKEYLKLLEVKIEKQRQVVILMSQEVEGLNKLEEKARNEYIEQQKKETENTLGEFISTKLGAKKITQKY